MACGRSWDISGLAEQDMEGRSSGETTGGLHGGHAKDEHGSLERK